jgi:two-component system LytT family response regulator
MTKCIIVDDEIGAREILVQMLKLYCTDIEIIGLAHNVDSAYELISSLNPDLVFLDIKMPDGSGFNLLERFPKLNFQVIFVTAHEEYAIKAFRFSALDYILKPVDPSDLINAVDKVSGINNVNDLDQQFKIMKENFYNESTQTEKKIVLRTTENIYVIPISEVVRCRSEKNYTYFYFTNREKIIVSRTLKDFEELLTDHGFMRVHRSNLINLKYISRYEKSEGGYVIMLDNSRVDVSHRKKEKLLNYINGLGDM